MTHKTEYLHKTRAFLLQIFVLCLFFITLNYSVAFSEEISLEETNSTEDQKLSEDGVPSKKKTIEYPMQYDADSITIDTKKKKILLFGDSVVQYGPTKLEAETISLNWNKSIIVAVAKFDKDGNVEKKLSLVQGGLEFFAEKIRYNFESQRAVASKLFAKIEDGLLRSNKVKKDPEDTYYSEYVDYTTCNLPRPHYRFGAQKIKMIYDDKAVSGPCHLYFDDVPTLSFFYGIFYFPKDSGVIFPKYGGDTSKGFHMKEFGYFFKFNDYIDLKLTSDVYTSGSIGFASESHYKKRYKYNGNLLYRKSKDIETDNSIAEKWQFKWKHATDDNRIRSWLVDIDLQNDSFRKSLSTNSGNGTTSTLQSSIKYTNKVVIPYYFFGAQITYNQDFKKKTADMILPNASLRTSNLYFTRWFGNSSGGTWYKDIYIQHIIEGKNKITSRTDNLSFFDLKDWDKLLEKKQYGLKNTVPAKTTVRIGYFNLIPFAEYRERWFWKHIDHTQNKTEIYRWERVWDYELGSELTTTFYGLFGFNGKSRLEAIRHQVKPSCKLTYTPDFSKEYWQKVGDGMKSRFENAVYDTPSNKKRLVLNMDINNALEAKISNKRNEPEGNKKIPIVDALDLGTSYDFIEKEGFPWGDSKISGRAKWFENALNISFSRIYDPYCYDREGGDWKRIPKKLAITHNRGIGHLKTATLNIGTQFGSENKSLGPTSPGTANTTEMQGNLTEDEEFEKARATYVKFSIPWTIGLAYDYTYTSPKPLDEKESKVLTFNTGLTMSENWILKFQTGYDLIEEKLVKSTTKVSIHRDLHCWDLDFAWLPLAEQQYYEFSVGIKAASLHDFRYQRERSYKNL